MSEVPSQLKGFYDQLVATVDRLPAAVKDVVNNGIKVPLSMHLTLVLYFCLQQVDGTRQALFLNWKCSCIALSYLKLHSACLTSMVIDIRVLRW